MLLIIGQHLHWCNRSFTVRCQPLKGWQRYWMHLKLWRHFDLTPNPFPKERGALNLSIFNTLLYKEMYFTATILNAPTLY